MSDDIPPDDAIEELDISELIDAHLEAQSADEFASEVPTVVELRRLCPGCGSDSTAVENDRQPPGSHAEAWRLGGCHGNARWWWCKGPMERKGEGRLTLIGSMEVFFFPDRRLVPR